MIQGKTITLYEKTKQGVDEFNQPIYSEKPITVENVLISPTSSDDVVNALNLTGKKAVYTLGIPKGDQHNWEDVKIEFFNQVWHSFGIPIEGIEENIPLKWNKKVMVERYG